MVIKDLARVLYAPQKAFKSIIQKPSYIGPIILLIIFIIATTGATYVIDQRYQIEQTNPTVDQQDVWTENSSYWTASSGTSIANNTSIYINDSVYYGTTSIQFTNSNADDVLMQINDIGTINYTEGYTNVSLSVLIVAPNVAPQNVMLTLLSGSSSFSRNLTSTFANGTTNVWYNLTVPLNTTDWVNSGSPSWDSITGLKMEFVWPTSANVNVIFDGLFFSGGFKNLLDYYGSAYIAQQAIGSASQFIFEWILLTGLMYLILKGFKVKSVWKPLFVSVGFALVVLIIQAVISGIIYSLLPNIYYGLVSETNIIDQTAVNQIALLSQIFLAVRIVIWIWLGALGTFLVRANSKIVPSATTPVLPYQPSETSTTPQTPSAPPQPGEELSWTKCAIVSFVSLILTALILFFLFGTF